MPEMIDLYPSRVGGEAEILKRKDPVVYGDDRMGPLDAQTIATYEDTGYLHLDSFLSSETLKPYQDELVALRHANGESTAPEVIREPESDVVRSIFRVHSTSPVFERLARDPGILAIVTQLLGSQVYVHHSRINYKPGFDGKEFYWHSDFETWHVEDGMPRMRAISCSISLTDNTPYNGPLMVVPGSHHHFVACPGKTPDNHFERSLRKQEIGVPDRESLTYLVGKRGLQQATGPAGSILLFECNLMHGSNGNITPDPRSNFFIVYNSIDNALVAPFGGQKPRPEFIRGTDFTPLMPY